MKNGHPQSLHGIVEGSQAVTPLQHLLEGPGVVLTSLGERRAHLRVEGGDAGL